VKVYVSAFVAMCVVAAHSANASSLIQNGNFSAGLSNWSTYNTSNGQSNPTTTNFDVTGNGVGPTLRLQVGDAVFPGFGRPPEGGGVYQNIILSSLGEYAFSADIASSNIVGTNGSGGVFSLLIDGLSVASFDTGSISSSVIRASLAYSGSLLAGTHRFSVQAARPYSVSSVHQYATNVSLQKVSAGAVPEPTAWILMISGFGMIGATMRRRAAREIMVSA